MMSQFQIKKKVDFILHRSSTGSWWGSGDELDIKPIEFEMRQNRTARRERQRAESSLCRSGRREMFSVRDQQVNKVERHLKLVRYLRNSPHVVAMINISGVSCFIEIHFVFWFCFIYFDCLVCSLKLVVRHSRSVQHCGPDFMFPRGWIRLTWD